MVRVSNIEFLIRMKAIRETCSVNVNENRDVEQRLMTLTITVLISRFFFFPVLNHCFELCYQLRLALRFLFLLQFEICSPRSLLHILCMFSFSTVARHYEAHLLEPFDLFWIIPKLAASKGSFVFLLTSVRMAKAGLTWE